MSPANPKSDLEWTLHSLNVHGVFFQRWCKDVFSRNNSWRVRSMDYPVEFPPPNNFKRGKESTLDIWAQHQSGDELLSLLVECKKHNPEFVNWLFFKKPRGTCPPSVIFHSLRNTSSEDDPAFRETVHQMSAQSFNVSVADEARETRSTYLDFKAGAKTRTSNASISEAAYQVALATQCVAADEAELAQQRAYKRRDNMVTWTKHVFMPTIVTSARLFECEFDPVDVDAATGEIPFDRAKLEEKPLVIFEYPLPRHLQGKPADIVDAWENRRLEWYSRLHIFVIQSRSLSTMLAQMTEVIE